MLYNETVFLFDDGVRFLLKLYHRGKVSRNILCRPHLCVNYSVNGIAKELTGFQASQRVFTIGEGENVGHITPPL